MKLRFLFAISIILCSYIFYNWVSQDNAVPQEEFIETVPTYVAHELKSTYFNSDGKPYRKLSTKEIQYYEYLSTGYLVKPNITYFPNQDSNHKKKKSGNTKKESNDMWTISADYGIANVHDNMNLRGNILGHTTNPDSVITDITANYLEYDLNTQDIRTNEIVTFTGKSIKNTCNHLSGNIKTQYFLLEDSCYASYSSIK